MSLGIVNESHRNWTFCNVWANIAVAWRWQVYAGEHTFYAAYFLMRSHTFWKWLLLLICFVCLLFRETNVTYKYLKTKCSRKYFYKKEWNEIGRILVPMNLVTYRPAAPWVEQSLFNRSFVNTALITHNLKWDARSTQLGVEFWLSTGYNMRGCSLMRRYVGSWDHDVSKPADQPHSDTDSRSLG
jgi:hypothetical protein